MISRPFVQVAVAAGMIWTVAALEDGHHGINEAIFISLVWLILLFVPWRWLRLSSVGILIGILAFGL